MSEWVSDWLTLVTGKFREITGDLTCGLVGG